MSYADRPKVGRSRHGQDARVTEDAKRNEATEFSPVMEMQVKARVTRRLCVASVWNRCVFSGRHAAAAAVPDEPISRMGAAVRNKPTTVRADARATVLR